MSFDRKYSLLRSQNRIDKLKALIKDKRRYGRFDSVIIFRSPEAQLKRTPYKVKRRRGRPTSTDYIAARSDFSAYQSNVESVLPEAAPFNRRSYAHTHDPQPAAVDYVTGLPTEKTFSDTLEYFRSHTNDFAADFVFITVDVSEFFILNTFSQRRFLNAVKTALLERLNQSVNFIGHSYPRYLSEDGVFIACLPRKLIIDEWLQSLNTLSFSIKSTIIDITPAVDIHSVNESPALLAVPKTACSSKTPEASSACRSTVEPSSFNLKLLENCNTDVEYIPYISLHTGLPVFLYANPYIQLPNNKISYDICAEFGSSPDLFQLDAAYTFFAKRICSRLSVKDSSSAPKAVALTIPQQLFDEPFHEHLIALVENTARLCGAMGLSPSSVVFGIDASLLERACTSPLIAEVFKKIALHRFSVSAENINCEFPLNLLDKFGVTHVTLQSAVLAESNDPLSFIRLLQAMGITVLFTGKTPHTFLTAKDIFPSLLIRLHNAKQT